MPGADASLDAAEVAGGLFGRERALEAKAAELAECQKKMEARLAAMQAELADGGAARRDAAEAKAIALLQRERAWRCDGVARVEPKVQAVPVEDDAV